MKIINLKINGLKHFENDTFEFDFRPISNVMSGYNYPELDLIGNKIYMPNSTCLVGTNASGKTVMLSNITWVLGALFSGYKIESLYNHLLVSDRLVVECSYIFEKGQKATLFQNNFVVVKKDEGMRVESEIIYSRKLFAVDTKGTITNFVPKDIVYDSSKIDFFNSSYLVNSSYLETKGYKFLMYHRFIYSQASNVENNYMTAMNSINEYNVYLFEKIILALDNNITSFKYIDGRNYELTLRGQKMTNSIQNLLYSLSEGTRQGIVLFYFASLVIKNGGLLIVDEIEMNLHKNLVITLINLFNNDHVNKKKSSILFSTHYTELSDLFTRNDVINIITSDEYFKVTNLAELHKRNNMKTSKLLLEETMQLNPSQDRIKDLRETLIGL